MQKTSDDYKKILADENHWFQSRVLIGEDSYLVDEKANHITFGGTSIYYSNDAGGYGENMIREMKTTQHLFSEDKPMVGCCVSSEISITLLTPTATIPKMAIIKPQVRALTKDLVSEWIPKGIYYVDTRSDDDESGTTELQGYDAMMKAENDFPAGDIVGTESDIEIVRYIAELMEVEVDPRTEKIMQREYKIPYPGGYSLREILGYIAAMYCGNFIMSDEGKLRLVRLYEIGAETRHLVDKVGDVITFGGDRILV